MKLLTLIIILSSCQTKYLEFSENLSKGFRFSNQGEGANGIYGGSGKVRPIDWVKKYDDDGNYISIWQADSILIQSKDFNYGKYRRNTYYPTDRFYLIDLKSEKLLGPYTREEFFLMTKKLKIFISWKPKEITN